LCRYSSEPDNEMTFEDAIKLKAEKKAAMMAAMNTKKVVAAKAVDDSAFKVRASCTVIYFQLQGLGLGV
jgi:hypothetical protein